MEWEKNGFVRIARVCVCLTQYLLFMNLIRSNCIVLLNLDVFYYERSILQPKLSNKICTTARHLYQPLSPSLFALSSVLRVHLLQFRMAGLSEEYIALVRCLVIYLYRLLCTRGRHGRLCILFRIDFFFVFLKTMNM